MQRRGGFTDGGSAAELNLNCHFEKKMELDTCIKKVTGYQCCASTAREPRSLCQGLTPWEINSEIPKSEKQKLLCFGIVFCYHDEYYPNKNCRIRGVVKLQNRELNVNDTY